MPLEMARNNLREDPSTHAIAEALGVEVEDYIDRVLEYATHPDKEVEVELLDDEAAAELGPDAPSMAQVMEWMNGVASGDIDLDDRVKIAESDGFTTQDAPSEVLRREAGAEAPVRRAPGVEQIQRGSKRASAPEAGSALKDQLLAQQRNLQLGMDARRAAKKPKS
ncbi:MAG: hypothetical protein AAFZ18_05740 [Myxococcota bacterium]